MEGLDERTQGQRLIAVPSMCIPECHSLSCPGLSLRVSKNEKTSKGLSGQDCAGCQAHSDLPTLHRFLILQFQSWNSSLFGESTQEVWVQTLLTEQTLPFWFSTLWFCENSTGAGTQNRSILGEAGFMVSL